MSECGQVTDIHLRLTSAIHLGHRTRLEPVLPFEDHVRGTPKVGNLVFENPTLQREDPTKQDAKCRWEWAKEGRKREEKGRGGGQPDLGEKDEPGRMDNTDQSLCIGLWRALSPRNLPLFTSDPYTLTQQVPENRGTPVQSHLLEQQTRRKRHRSE
jgi:hypothetical protein